MSYAQAIYKIETFLPEDVTSCFSSTFALNNEIRFSAPTLPKTGSLSSIPGVTFEEMAVGGLSPDAFLGHVTLLNIWAPWNIECQMEHDLLMALAWRPNLVVFGLVAADTETQVRTFLQRNGNPYQRLSLDENFVYQRALHHRGVPQNYVFDAKGGYVGRLSGGLTPTIIREKLDPMLREAGHCE